MSCVGEVGEVVRDLGKVRFDITRNHLFPKSEVVWVSLKAEGQEGQRQSEGCTRKKDRKGGYGLKTG